MRLHFFNSAFIVNSKMDYFVKMYLPVNLNTRGCCRQRGGGGGNFFIFDFVRILYLICICYFFQ